METNDLSKDFMKKSVENDAAENNSIQLDNWLQSLGKSAFVEVLYPALKQNINITQEELAAQNPRYASWKTQQQRLSTAKSIFKNGLEREALQIIVDSNADSKTKKAAEDYLKKM